MWDTYKVKYDGGLNMFTLVFCIAVCLALVAIFIFIRVKKGGVEGVATKVLASFGFVALALFLSAMKVGQNVYSRYATTLIICGLVCDLIGDVLLDLKVIYPFHEDKYLSCGMTSFLVGHLFFNGAMALLFVDQNANSLGIPLIIILVVSAILAVILWFVTSHFMHLNYGSHAILSTIYAGVLLFTTIFSIYLAVVTLNQSMFIFAVGFVLFLASDLVLSLQYFGGKQSQKSLIIINHMLYYFAQILIAMTIYFI